MKYCEYCGQANLENGSFCNNCGARLPEQPVMNGQNSYGQPQNPYVRSDIYPQQYPVPQYPAPPSRQTDGMSVCSLVLGILSIVNSCFYGAGILFGIGGIIFAAISRSKATSEHREKDSSSLAGLICSIVGIAISILVVVFLILCFMIGNDFYENYEAMQG